MSNAAITQTMTAARRLTKPAARAMAGFEYPDNTYLHERQAEDCLIHLAPEYAQRSTITHGGGLFGKRTQHSCNLFPRNDQTRAKHRGRSNNFVERVS